MFFERYNEWLTANLGDAQNWPSTLNFSRVVRNACAHGSITFRNPGTAKVVWRDLSYRPEDNGRTVMGLDIRLGEIIALMFEAADELDAIGAPTL